MSDGRGFWPGGQLRAVVDPEKCNGCGTCVDVCPDVFVLKNDEVAEVKVGPVPGKLEDCAITAREECMAGVIEILRE